MPTINQGPRSTICLTSQVTGDRGAAEAPPGGRPVLTAGLGGEACGDLEIAGPQPGVFSDARKHFGADFFALVERENEIGPFLRGPEYDATPIVA